MYSLRFSEEKGINYSLQIILRLEINSIYQINFIISLTPLRVDIYFPEMLIPLMGLVLGFNVEQSQVGHPVPVNGILAHLLLFLEMILAQLVEVGSCVGHIGGIPAAPEVLALIFHLSRRAGHHRYHPAVVESELHHGHKFLNFRGAAG